MSSTSQRRTAPCCGPLRRAAAGWGQGEKGFWISYTYATGTLPLKNAAGEVSAEELQRAILCAQQMLLSEVKSTDIWCQQIAPGGMPIR
jgi:hypothetical protein